MFCHAYAAFVFVCVHVRVCLPVCVLSFVTCVYVSRVLCHDCVQFLCFAGGLLPRTIRMVAADSSYVFAAFKAIDTSIHQKPGWEPCKHAA